MANQYNAITTRANGQTITADWFNTIKTTLVNNGAVKHNISATTAPAVGDDSDDNYEPGSTWTDTTNDNFYVCVDASVGAAVWYEVADTSTAQTFTNKTLTSPTINGSNLNMGTASDTNRILLASDTTTNLDLLTDTAGLIAYDTTLGKVVFNDGSGWVEILNNPMTTNGDIIYENSGVQRLGIGSAGEVLTVSSGLPEWQAVSVTPTAPTSKTTTYTATTADDHILADTSGGAWTLTLYAASTNGGRRLRVTKTTSDSNALTIDGNGAETIDGSTTITLDLQYESVLLYCDGSNWLIEREKVPTVAAIYETNAGQSITNSTFTIVDYEDSVVDTHSSVTTGGSWAFTAPKAGLYEVSATVNMNALDDQKKLELRLYVNGGVEAGAPTEQASVNDTHGTTVTAILSLSKNDTVDARVYHEDASANNLNSLAVLNRINIVRVGS